MSRFKKMPESTSYRVISHCACELKVCFSLYTWYSDSESSPNRSLLFARDGQPLNSPISSLGLKARQSWQRLSFSLEKKTLLHSEDIAPVSCFASRADCTHRWKWRCEKFLHGELWENPLLIQSDPEVLHSRSFANCHFAQLDFQVFNTLRRDSAYSLHNKKRRFSTFQILC